MCVCLFVYACIHMSLQCMIVQVWVSLLSFLIHRTGTALDRQSQMSMGTTTLALLWCCSRWWTRMLVITTAYTVNELHPLQISAMASLGTDTKLKVLQICLDALQEFQTSYKGKEHSKYHSSKF